MCILFCFELFDSLNQSKTNQIIIKLEIVKNDIEKKRKYNSKAFILEKDLVFQACGGD